MKISRAAAWGIVIADTIGTSLLIPHFYDSRLLFLQLSVVVLILWKSLWVARPAREEKSLPITNRQAVGIGILVGLSPLIVFIVFSIGVSISNQSSILEQVFFAIYIFIGFFSPGVPFGIAGALAGNHWKKTRRTASIGAILGTIIGIGVWTLLWNMLGELPIYLPQ